MDHAQVRAAVDGHRQEPLQERRSLLGQCLRDAGAGKPPGGGFRVGTHQADRRTGPPCRGALYPAQQGQERGTRPRQVAAGTSGLVAVHSGQPAELSDRGVAQFTLGVCTGCGIVGTAGPAGAFLAAAWHQTLVAPGRTNHFRPVDRADVHRQPWPASAPGNVDPQPGSAHENLPDAFAGHGRTPEQSGPPVQLAGQCQFDRAGTSACGNRAGCRRHQPDGRHHSGSRQPR